MPMKFADVTKDTLFINRPTMMGSRHAIVAGHYLATHAGFMILEAGGNAVDAGVAAGIALGVLQADRVNFGGVAPQMIYVAKERKVYNIDGLGVWPRAITPDYFERKHKGLIPIGVERSVVPAAPDAWITALRRFGTMTFGDVASAAIRFARDGFPMYQLMSEFISTNIEHFARWPSTKAIFAKDGHVPKIGEMFVQADLGRSLQHLVDVEKANSHKGRDAALVAARDAFYKGDIASAIVKFHKETGGFMTAEDLADFNVKFEKPVVGRFRNIEIQACGPWSQGPVVPMALQLLEKFDLKAMGHNSPEYLHHIVEALKLAFADRHHHFGDPDFVSVPMDGLLSERYTEYRRAQMKAERAYDGMPFAGDPATCTALPHRWVPPPAPEDQEVTGDTSYLAVVDRFGNGFSATPSDGTYATPIIPGTGMVCSGRGVQSWADTTHPCSVAPGKRPRLTPNPAFAFRDGKLLMPFGSPGGDVQPQAMLQLFLNINVFNMDVQAACEAPRVTTYSFPGSFQPHDYFPNRLYLEDRIPPEVGDVMASKGHKVRWWIDRHPLAGAACAILVDGETGTLHAGADFRRPAYALAW